MTALMNQRRPHPADGMTQWVDLGDGAAMCIVSPQNDPSIEWALRYGDAESVRYTAAAVISSYDYLISEPMSMKEATRRLRLARKAYREAEQAPLQKSSNRKA